MEITYREARPGDAQALLEFLKAVGGESDNLTFGSEGLPFSAEQEEAFLESRQNSPHSRILLALDGDQIVGNATLDGSDNPRFRHRYSFAITVRKSHWGRQIGSGLMERQIAFAKKAGAEVIGLEVRSDNDRAIALYRKFGFEKYGTYPKFFKINGEYFDIDYMNLYL
ncbi:MAG: GNAT family N-acetyltransferase [Oscillospiraceae bacterium]|nr:GNAT family N-acetyltransferase [Oscillospiraceae bacterium]